MTEWVAVGGGFMKADVIRWKEGDWEQRGPRGRQRSVLIGERVVTAEVLKEADEQGWVSLKVVDCTVGVSRVHRKEVGVLKAGREIRRSYAKIVRGRPERLLWSEEQVRAVLSSKFLGNKEHERFMVMETDEEAAKPAPAKRKARTKPPAPKRRRPRVD